MVILSRLSKINVGWSPGKAKQPAFASPRVSLINRNGGSADLWIEEIAGGFKHGLAIFHR